MSFELAAKTEPGRRLVAIAESLADEILPDAAVHDRDGTFPFASLAIVKERGYLRAPVPESLGGLGVASVHDLVVASSRLARGDAALTIGVNMHLAYVVNLLRRWQEAHAARNERRIAAFGASLAQIAEEGLVLAAAISEPTQDLTRPATVAARTDEGWTISGRKVFCTMSPAADVLYTAVTYVDDHGRETYGYALVPTATPGLVLHDDWDALGMRASGSNSVSFDDLRLPESALRGGFPVDSTVDYIERNLDAGLLHAAAALGAAEYAHAHAAERIARNGHEPDGRSRTIAAENAVELSAGRAVLGRAAALIDEHFAPGWTADLTLLFAEAQAAKMFVGESAVRIVDRALALSGGAGYLNGSPLPRAYRDVRATAFMHPLGANRAYDYLGRIALGSAPSLH
jgi:alkylation response protein AidB-like acyl-CoA dehydrogenase